MITFEPGTRVDLIEENGERTPVVVVSHNGNDVLVEHKGPVVHRSWSAKVWDLDW